jgi:exoribonuclease-2
LQGRPPLSEEEVLVALAAGEAAAAATVLAERASRAHWTAVYLAGKLDRKDTQWEGIIMERKGNRFVVMIPALALETQVTASAGGGLSPNDPITLTLSSVKIPEAEAVFLQ